MRCSKFRPGEPADVTLVNLNLMLVNLDGHFDEENYIPLGLLYIASYLGRNGYNVDFLDYQLFSRRRSFNPIEFVDTMGRTGPVVGLSCMSNLLPFAILVAEEIKKRRPETTVVLGGVGPSPVAQDIIRAFPFVDIVVEGEGEEIVLEILRGNRERLPAPRRIINLDDLPLPAYGLLHFPSYTRARSIITSRGCPFSCAFCTEPHNFGGQVRFRGIGSIVEEIEWLHAQYEHESFLFQDDILPMNRQRFQELLAALRRLSFPIKWKCFSRVDLMDESLMAEMAESGCVQIRYGIESGSNATLKRIRKGFTIEEAFAVTSLSTRRFPSVHTSFIWGYPFEDLAGFEETLQWVERFEAAGATVLLFEFSPLPGSELFRMYQKDLRFSKDAYSNFVITGQETVRSDGRLEADGEQDRSYRLIAEHPRIFPGFYHYENARTLRMAQRLDQFKLTGRNSAQNVYDR